MIATIARHESAAQLRASQSWLIAAALALACGYLFLQQLESWLDVQARLALQDHSPGLSGFLAARFLAPLAMLFSVVAPLFAMRAFSDEFRLATFALWQSSPVSDTSLVLGKFLGVSTLPLALVALVTLMTLSMGVFVDIDGATLTAATLGLVLMSTAGTAIGLYFSSLTRQAMVAVLAAFAVLALLWLLGSGGVDASREGLSGLVFAALQALAIGERLGGFFQGYVRSDDILYFVLLTALFLTLTILRIGSLRGAAEP